MRVVLIVAGGVATCMVVVMAALLVADKRADARPHVDPPKQAAEHAQEDTWSWVRIDRGIAVSAMETYCTPGTPPRPRDVSLAVFRADDATSPAVRLFKTTGSTYELPLDAGRYEICSGGWSVDPSCSHPGGLTLAACPANDKLCTCTPADGSRKTWSAMCQKVNVGNGVVRITVGMGLGIGYSCEPKEACPR